MDRKGRSHAAALGQRNQHRRHDRRVQIVSSRWISASNGFAPARTIELTVEKKVKGVVRPRLPGPTSAAAIASHKASVPEAHPIPWATPRGRRGSLELLYFFAKYEMFATPQTAQSPPESPCESAHTGRNVSIGTRVAVVLATEEAATG